MALVRDGAMDTVHETNERCNYASRNSATIHRQNAPLNRTTSHDGTSHCPLSDRNNAPHVDSLKNFMEAKVSLATDSTASSTDAQTTAKHKTLWQHCCGSILALGSGIVLTIASVAAKTLLSSFTTGHIGLFRFVFFCLTTVPFLAYRRINPFGWQMLKCYGLLLLLRACMGSSAYLFRVFTFSKLPVGDATTIMFCSPIFVGLFARIFLREHYSRIFFVSTTLGLCGCALISRPHFLFQSITVLSTNTEFDTASAATRLEGAASAILSAISTGLVVVLVRKLRQFDPSVVIFHFGCVGALVSVAICLSTEVTVFPTPKTWHDAIWIAVLALSSSAGQWLFTLSLHYETANIVSLLRTTDVLWAFVAQVLVFDNAPHWLSVVGASLITCGVVLLGVSKAFRTTTGGGKNQRNLLCGGKIPGKTSRRRLDIQLLYRTALRARALKTSSGGSGDNFAAQQKCTSACEAALSVQTMTVANAREQHALSADQQADESKESHLLRTIAAADDNQAHKMEDCARAVGDDNVDTRPHHGIT